MGFVALRRLDKAIFVAKISVSKDDQRKGVGTALLEHVDAEVKRRGGDVVSLTTFRDVPWNGKWYERTGFVELSDQEVEARLGPEHVAILQKSRENHQRPGWRWMAMAKWF